ncbi:MAG: ATP-binding cassette domain-containing protein, partial [Mycoplasmataceae bacterium]|nr:ATP-binding cassette domain-containing protein [Mycoplasmataceae bacterium]
MKKKDDVILSVKNLDKYFVNGAFVIKATDNLNFDLSKGEIIGLIGQSGSGKSTAGKAIIRLFKEVTGSIFLEDEIISGAKLSRKNEKKMRSDIQMIFQNPHGSLSPKRNIYSTLMEPLKVHKIVEKEVAEISKNWVELMRINELSFIIGYAKMMLEYFLKRNKEFSLFDNSFQKLKGDVVTGFLTLKEIENYKEGKNKYLLSNIKGIRKSSARISELFNVAEQNFKDEKLSSSNEIKYYDARIELKTFILNKQMVAKKEKYFKDSIKDVAKERKEEIDKYNRNITSVIKSLSVKKKFFGSIAGLTTDPEQYYVYKAFEISVNKSQKLLKQIKNANYFYNA